jgi:hypothetical protein
MQAGASLIILLACAATLPAAAAGEPDGYRQRVKQVTRARGLVAFWDFVKREPGGAGARFDAHKAKSESADLRLDALNYVRDFWGEGRQAGYADIPLLGRGPFGQAIEIRPESENDFRPCLIVPRERLHGSGLDVKGPRQSVSMLAWVVRRSGNHAIAGIWHEGTDLLTSGKAAARIERGKRQYALFAGLAGNDGGSAVHVSENGAKSFGDKYARNMAVTSEKLKTVPSQPSDEQIDAAWSVMGFTFDNHRNTVTAYLDGRATEFWIEKPFGHPFYKWPANGWLQAELRRQPGVQPAEDPAFPANQFYTPPESKPRRVETVSRTPDERVEVRHYEFTRVRVTLRRLSGKWHEQGRELVALKANPFWFGHDLYTPATIGDGGPFTIGRVIHSSRSVGFTGWIGGVAVFNRALSPKQMLELSRIGVESGRLRPLRLSELQSGL